MFTAIKNTFEKVRAALINDGTGVKDRIYPTGKRARLIAIYQEGEKEKPEAQRLKEADERTKKLEALLAEKQQAGQHTGWIELKDDEYPFIVEETKFENSEKLKYLRTVDESMGKRIEEIAAEQK